MAGVVVGRSANSAPGEYFLALRPEPLPLNPQSLPSGILAWKSETDKGGFIRFWRIPQGRNPKSEIERPINQFSRFETDAISSKMYQK
jgi:hypothetical protein